MDHYRNETTNFADKHLAEAHADMVARLAKPGDKILETLTPEKCHLWHMATGVSGKAGELCDALKRFVIYNKELDRANVIEELGDLEFYLEGIRQGLRISRIEVLEKNMEKLEKGKNARYKSGNYSDSQAQERTDKAGE